MTDYRVALGHDIPYENLNVIDPQPRGDLAAPVVRNYGIDGSIHQQGLYACWHWDFVESYTQYLAILTYFGLETTADNSNLVTIYTRNERSGYIRYNGIALAPEVGSDIKWENFFLRDLKIYIVDLEEP